tara:strand:+ start:1032 stop:1259 length:228 start_codon:yes stop_codon:yes gene_type:complete
MEKRAESVPPDILKTSVSLKSASSATAVPTAVVFSATEISEDMVSVGGVLLPPSLQAWINKKDVHSDKRISFDNI